MSASAENLIIENSSANLVTLLDQSFQTDHKCSTAPTSNFTSPNNNKRFHSQSMTSNSTNSNIKKGTDASSNHFASDEWNLNNDSDNIDIIVEENSLSEVVNNFIIIKSVETQHHFISDIFNSPKRTHTNRYLKRCYSFNDINIKHIGSLNKKHGSIQTFISINATLSTEIESNPMQSCDQQTSDDFPIEKKVIPSESEEFAIEIINDKKNYFGRIKSCISHPLFITGAVITGMIILVPTFNKLHHWMPSKLPKSSVPFIDDDPLSNLKPLSPEFLFTSNSPLYETDDDFVFTNSIKSFIFIPNILQEQFKRITEFIYDGFRK